MQKAKYLGQVNKGLSGNLWKDCPIAEIMQDPSVGFFLFDDFRTFGLTNAVAANVGRYAGLGGAFKSWEDTGGSIALLPAEQSGVVRLATSGTDNDSVTLNAAGDVAGLFTLNTPANAGGKLWMEARIRVNQIVTGNWCFGLMKEATAADNGQFTDAGAFADTHFAGFCCKEAASATLDATYRKSGSAETTFISGVRTLTATTWMKLGMRYDPSNANLTGLEWYIDNVRKLNSLSAGFLPLTGNALFPSALPLLPTIGLKNSTALLNQIDIDWIAVAGERA